jgi:phosphate transport system permease protein
VKNPRTLRDQLHDKLFRFAAMACGSVVLLLMVGFFIELGYHSMPSIKKFGVEFLLSNEWNPVTQEFGAASSIYGTVVSTIIAMVLAVPLSFVIAFFLVELAPPKISKVISEALDLLAAIPSIIYGMWGLFVFAPVMQDYIQPILGTTLGFIPLFKGPPMGIGMLTSGIILSLMILPFISAVMRDVFKMVPPLVKESAYGVGATKWEVCKDVTARYGLQGMIGATFLGLGRAFGETMAVTFVIGNAHNISASLFAPGNSIASTLANEFSEATELIYVSSLIELGLVLFVMTYLVQVGAQYMLRKMYKSWSVGL